MKSETNTIGEGRLSIVFDTLGDKTRLEIFRILLRESPSNNLCVSDIAKRIGISIPAASKQLRLMELAGIVKPKRSGQMICYQVTKASPLIRDLTKIIKRSIE